MGHPGLDAFATVRVEAILRSSPSGCERLRSAAPRIPCSCRRLSVHNLKRPIQLFLCFDAAGALNLKQPLGFALDLHQRAADAVGDPLWIDAVTDEIAKRLDQVGLQRGLALFDAREVPGGFERGRGSPSWNKAVATFSTSS